MKNHLNNTIALDEEQTLIDSFESGEWRAVPLTAEEKQAYITPPISPIGAA